jgi:hypothetical protein
MKGVATPATIADHVESHRGDWSAFLSGKLQSLCAPCHDSLKKLHDRRQRLDDDGRQLPEGPRAAKAIFDRA